MDQNTSVKQFSSFLPLALFGLTLVILLGNEILTSKAEIEASDTLLASRREAVAKAGQQQQRLNQLASDLLAAGETDEYAARVVQSLNLKAHVKPAGK